MFDPTFAELDLGFLTDPYVNTDDEGAPSKTIEGQYEEEKGDIGWLEATSDLQAFMNIGALPEVTSEDQEVKSVMKDVEQFLQNFDYGPTPPAIDDTIPQEEMDAAEQLLDELLKSNDLELNLDNFETDPTMFDQQEEVQTNESSAPQDNSFIDMSDVTKVVTEDGKEVYIVIAPPPEPLSDDSEWTPPTTSPKGRPLVKRHAKTSTSSNRKPPYYIKDKKERKKHQNVQAARKYRDKKKDEQNKIETEELFFATKNSELKSQVAELEAEVKTMKKLMTELGIIKM